MRFARNANLETSIIALPNAVGEKQIFDSKTGVGFAIVILRERVAFPPLTHPPTMFSIRTCILFWLIAVPSFASPPLHQQIDARIAAQPDFKKNASVLSDDATFLRRIYLDLTGCIPAPQHVRDFIADESADKRTRKIDELLASPAHAERLQFVFNEMLMERKGSKHVSEEEWRSYLRRSFADNKPWDEFVREVLSENGEETRAAARFLLDRELNMDNVTRDLGRIFLGRDLQCAQCHDHPAIEEYRQRHYYGLTAFLKRSYLFKNPKSGKTTIGEKAEGDVEFTSVFTSEADTTAPRMLDLPALADPPAAKEPYKVKKSKTTAGVPVYSRRLQLAEAMTDDANTAFRLNIANRIWAMMLGRGLVEPLDMMHTDNPPSHPEILQLLADSLLEHDYDLRFLIRELALTETYQRSTIVTTNTPAESPTYFAGLLKPLSPEQLAMSMLKAVGDPVVEPVEDEAAQKKNRAALQKKIDQFVNMFDRDGQSTTFDAAANQALFLRNNDLLQSLIETKNGTLDRLAGLSNEEVAEEFYLAVFSRLPAEIERAQLTQYVNSKEDRREAISQALWAALVSAEFRFNH